MAAAPDAAPGVVRSDVALENLRTTKAEANRRGQHEIVAFYSSVIGGITHDPALMHVPIDDHLITRGHGVFDTCNVSGGKAYGIDFHLDRLLRSAKQARIDLSSAVFLGRSEDPVDIKKRLKAILLHTIAASGKRDGVYCRFWLSAARGDFAINPTGCLDQVNFYAVVHRSGSAEDNLAKTSASVVPSALTESTVSIAPKSKYLATLKSNNYLVNAMCAMEAADKTGDMKSIGLQVDPRTGLLTEFAIGAVAIIGADNVLRTPHQDNILASTTLARSMQLARSQLMPRGILSGAVFSDITVADALAANEILELGGGTCRAVVKINGKIVGSGKPGKVSIALNQLLIREQRDSQFTDRIPYEKFATAKL